MTDVLASDALMDRLYRRRVDLMESIALECLIKSCHEIDTRMSPNCDVYATNLYREIFLGSLTKFALCVVQLYTHH